MTTPASSAINSSMPLSKTITLLELTAQDDIIVSEALALLNLTQGNGLFASDYLHKRFGDLNNFVIAAFDNQKLIGIAVAEIINNFDYYLPFDSNLNQELSNKIVGSFSTLSVLESYQGKGIGQLLSEQRIEWLLKHHCDVALGVSWISGLVHTSNRTFEKAGFRAIKSLTDFYHKSSIAHPFDCPGCHKIPCLCGAILYRRDFSY